MSACVTVIIAAFNAQSTLARAIRSALEQPQTAEVIVVDDASDDSTCLVANEEAARDPRVRLIRQAVNQGPAAARNLALDAATSEYLAILDSDDVFIPGRLDLLLSCQHYEMAADNIAFVTPEYLTTAISQDWSTIAPDFTPLGLTEFVLGNLRQDGVSRGELGFLKPVLSRAFLDKHKLRYDPTLRLGEDYDLYVRMMLAGARMRVTCRPGYAAVVRYDSLSAQHSAADLAALQTALESHLDAGGQPPNLTRAMQAHLRDVRHKRDHRVCLDLRRRQGIVAALQYLFGAGDRAWPVVRQIVRDKLNLNQMAGDTASKDGSRLLLPPDGL